MGVLTVIFKSRDKPTKRLNDSGYCFFFVGTTSGKVVNERSSMQMIAVYSPLFHTLHLWK